MRRHSADDIDNGHLADELNLARDVPAAGAATGGREGSAVLGSMFTRLSLTINHMCKLIWQTARDMKVCSRWRANEV